jgi:hypothetical protein
LVFLLFATFVNAQDIVLSQPFMSGQLLSPASVGNGLYKRRIKGNLKAQMIGGNNLYQTMVVGMDTRFKSADENSKNYLGIGGQIVSDQVNNGLMQSNYIGLNLAYHIFIDKYLYKDIALGFGTVFAQTTLDKSKLFFGDQYDYAGGITSNGTMESLPPYPSEVSAIAGLLYTQHNQEVFIQTGVNASFFSKPNITYSITNSATEYSYQFFTNMEFPILSTYSIALHGNMLYKKVKNQYFIGATIGAPISNDEENLKRIYFGCFYRYKEAVVPNISFISNQYIFGISYDIYNPKNNGANLRMSSIELTLSASFGVKKTDLFRTIFD